MKRLLIFAVLLGLASCSRKEDRVAGPVIEAGDVHIDLGLAGVIDGSRWNLFRVRVRNRGLDFRGTLEVRGVVLGDRSDPIAYRMELEIPGGSNVFRDYAFPVRPEGWTELKVSFNQPGFGRSFRLPLPLPEAPAFRVLVIGDQVRDLRALQEYLAAELKKGETEQTAALEAKFAFLPPSDCPTFARAYDSFQLVLLEGTSLDDASDGAIDALAAWAKGGGTLAAIPAPQWVGGPPDKLRDLLASATVLPEVPRAKHAVFPRPQERPELYHALDACLGRAMSFAGDSSSGLREIERSIAGSLYSLSGLHAPSRGAVVLGLFLYAVLGFFIPVRIFKRLGRREWSFAVMVAAAGLAAFVIYGLGVFSSVGATEIDEVSVVRVAPDGKTGQATSFLGLISPGFERIDLKDPESDSLLAGALPQPLRAMRQAFYRSGEDLQIPETEIRIEKGHELRLAPVRLFPNAMHFLRFDHETAIGGTLEVKRVPGSDGRNEIRLVNRGKSRLEFFLLERKRMANSRALEPGEEGILPAWSSFQFTELSDDSLFPSPFGTTSWAGRETAERLAINTIFRGIASPHDAASPYRFPQVPQQQQGGATAKIPWDDERPRFLIAVSRDPVFPVVDGVRTRKAISVYVVELSREDAP